MAAHGAEEDILRRGVGPDAEVTSATTVAGGLKVLAVTFDRVAVGRQALAWKRDFPMFPGLGIQQSEVPEGGRFEFLGGEDLDEVDVQAAVGEGVEGGKASVGIETVAEDHGDAAAPQGSGHLLDGEVPVGTASGNETGEVTKEKGGGAQPGRRAEHRMVGGLIGHVGTGPGERVNGDTIVGGEGDVGDAGGQAAGEIELGGRAEVHGGAGMEEDVEPVFAFVLMTFYVEAVEAAVEVPVEVPKVVAGGVVPVVGEFDGVAAGAAGSFAAPGVAGTVAGRDAEAVELAQEGRGEDQVVHRAGG